MTGAHQIVCCLLKVECHLGTTLKSSALQRSRQVTEALPPCPWRSMSAMPWSQAFKLTPVLEVHDHVRVVTACQVRHVGSSVRLSRNWAFTGQLQHSIPIVELIACPPSPTSRTSCSTRSLRTSARKLCENSESRPSIWPATDPSSQTRARRQIVNPSRTAKRHQAEA